MHLLSFFCCSAFLRGLKTPISFQMKEVAKHSAIDDEAELKLAMEINDQWNAEIAQAR